MNLATFVLALCLVGQAGDSAEEVEEPVLRRRAPAHPIEQSESEAEAPADRYSKARREHAVAEGPADAAEESDGERRLESVDGAPRQKLRPPELLAEALETPVEGALVGTPMTLQAAISRVADRGQQLRIAQAYWRLSTAQADYHWARNSRDLLAHHTQPVANLPATLSARAAARADVRDAQVVVAQAQQELADLVDVAADAALPLASDRPHVGDYRTYYESIFSNRQPPARLRLIHRTLPVRRKAIDGHAEAVVAALDAVEATGAEFKKHGQGLATLLATIEQLKRERQAFIREVRDYNQEIAEYALAVAPAGADGGTLVSMLIKTSPPRSSEGQRERAPARPSKASPRTGAGGDQTRGDADVVPRTAGYQAAAQADEEGAYQGLLNVNDPPVRVQKLANWLHWDRNLPADAGESATLADCLRGVPAERRVAVIDAYWNAREQAARYQALSDRVEQLAALPSIAVRMHDQPGMAEASVRLHAARRAARAAVFDAHVVLLIADFELTQVAGRRVDEAWLLPTTAPQAGRYLAPLARQTTRQAPSHHWSSMVRLQHEKLEERADGVIQADAQRVLLVNEARRGAAPEPGAGAEENEPMHLDSATWAIARQTEQTLAFLHDLSGYNRAIARYAQATFPAGISSDELVKKLVIGKSTRRDS